MFGASGRIGSEMVRQGAAAGHDMTAVVRRGSAVTGLPEDARLVEVAGISDPEMLVPAVAGRDAVLSGLGPRARRDAGVTAPMIRCLLGAMDRSDVCRILVVSAAPVAAPHRDDSFVTRRVMWPLISRILRPVYVDLREMENDLSLSDTEWTAVRPPRLVNREVTGRYRTAIGENLPRVGTISRADVAHAMLAMINDRATYRRAVGVAW
ncbi:MAG TPA: NAD(P)H-binding protein [Jiangellaceae bacterium]